MGERIGNDQLGERARILAEDLDKPMTAAQRDWFLSAFDKRNIGKEEKHEVEHAHREQTRSSTTVPSRTARHEADGVSVELRQDRNTRILRAVIVEPGAGSITTTEREWEITPASPTADYFDEFVSSINTETGEPVQAPPDVNIFRQEEIEPGIFVEEVLVGKKPNEHALTQGRWQDAMDVLDLCPLKTG